MKNKIFQYFGILIAIFFATGCQNFDEPAFGDYPLDPPIITLNTPNAGGSTVIRSSDPIAPITFNFQVEDDIEISNITVNVDGIDVANMNQFTNGKMVLVDDLIYDASTGTHTLTITATDSHDNVVTLSTTFVIEEAPPYNPTFAGEMFYMNFDGNYTEAASNIDATEVGTPGFAGEGRVGSDAYAGATDSYLTFPTDGLLGSEFSASFWINTNATPNRAGILTISPEDTANPINQNNRSTGIRLFREDVGGEQVLKLNIGSDGDRWFDGGATAALPIGEWAHVAISIGLTEAVVYINGQVVSQGAFPGLVWTGCDLLSIGSGAPRFVEWGHKYDLSYVDELRLFNVALTQSDITNIIAQADKTFDMPFDGSFTESVSQTDATVVGSPGFAGEAKVGTDAYAGATDSYLTFPTEGLLSSEFSATFWINTNATPNRAGILTISPEDTANPTNQNNRSTGIRLFREDVGGEQVLKLNIGSDGDRWFDGGVTAALPIGEWAHVGISIGLTEAVVYINGQVVSQGAFPGLVWTGCDLLSIGSGAPRFVEWGHKYDLSYLDELQLFNKALTQSDIQAIMAE